MKTKLLLFSALALIMLCFNGCTNQFQPKPLVIKVTLANPIHSCSASGSPVTANVLEVYSNANGLQELNGLFLNQVGQDEIVFNTVAASTQAQVIVINYLDFLNANPDVYYCNTVTAQITFDGEIVYEESRQMGSEDATCGDGFEWHINFTLP